MRTRELPPPKGLMDQLGRVVDQVVGVFSPVAQERRLAARVRSTMLSGVYRSARSDRTQRDWITGGISLSADGALLGDLETARERCRELTRDNAIARSIIRVMVDNVVGPGLRLQSRVDAEALEITEEQAQRFQVSAERVFRRSVPYLDSTMRLDWYGLQALAFQRVCEDGEVLAVPTLVKERNRPFETAIELVEGDRLRTPNSSDISVDEQRQIRSGVQLGVRGQPLAYWIQRTHPGDRMLGLGPQRREFVRLPQWGPFGLRRVMHVYRPARPGQTRGEPMLIVVTDDLKDLGEFEESAAMAARIESCFSAFISRNDPYAAQVGATYATDSEGNRIEAIEPGMIEYLGPGESVTFGDPKRPGANFAPYVLHKIRRCGAGVGLPLELVFCDFQKVTFTSGRMAVLEAGRMFRRWRAMLVERFCQPTYELLLAEAAGKDLLELPPGRDFFADRDLWSGTRWIEPSRGWIDPRVEVDASTGAIQGQLSTQADECGAQGRDWEEVQDQLLREELRWKRRREELGLTSPTPPPPAPVGDAPDDGDEDQADDVTDGEDQGAPADDEASVDDESEAA